MSGESAAGFETHGQGSGPNWRVLSELSASARRGTLTLTEIVVAASVLFLCLFAVLIRFNAFEDTTRDVGNLILPSLTLLIGIRTLRTTTGRDRAGWLAVEAGVLLWLAGDSVFAFYTLFLGREVPFPSVAEIAYIPGYFCYGLGFALLSKVDWEWPEARVLIDAGTMLLALVALSWPFLLGPTLSSDLPAFTHLIAISYPVLDVAVAGVLIFGFYASKERAPVRFMLFAGAIGTSIVADSMYATQVTPSGEYQHALDVLFAASYCLIAIAFASHQSAGQVESALDRARRTAIGVHLPRLLTIPVVALAILDTGLGGIDAAVVDIGAVALILLLALRQAITSRENEQLLVRVQRDSDERAALLRALGDLGEAFATIENGRIVTANDALWLILGYTEDELREFTSLADVVVDDDRDRIRALVDRAVTQGTVISGVEISMRARNGQEVAIELAAMLLKANGRAQLLIVARDITERRKSQRLLLESQKIEGLRVLAGGVAHDFNNLLQVIRGSASLALLEAGPESAAAPYLQDIDTASDRAAGLARQMLIYAGKAEPIVSRVEPAKVVEDMALLLSSSLGEGIRLEVTSGRYTHRLLLDASQLRQVVMNLVVNASEAIGAKGGTIRVNTANHYLDVADLADANGGSELQPGLYVVIEVSDTGEGMTEEVRRRLFDPFYTTKFTGRGLGLAAVLGIVRSHGGGIIVESTPGNGAKFRVVLPANIGIAKAAI